MEVFLARKGEILGREERALLREHLLPSQHRPAHQFHHDLFPLVPFYKHYFYHWLVEYLPKVKWLSIINDYYGIQPHILIPKTSPPFVLESLSLLGIDKALIRVWPGHIRGADRVWLTNHHPHAREVNYLVSKRDIEWISGALRESVSDWFSRNRQPPHISPFIYVSRQQARSSGCQAGLRRLGNLDQIMPDLVARGFDIVDLNAMPLKEQIFIMMNAKLILGPHGAGLTHMIFSDRAAVIEIFPVSAPLPFFSLLAAASGCTFAAVPADYVEGELIVSKDVLLRVLDRVLEGIQAKG